MIRPIPSVNAVAASMAAGALQSCINLTPEDCAASSKAVVPTIDWMNQGRPTGQFEP